MNKNINIRELERWLKSSLKNKVSIDNRSVIAYLMMGFAGLMISTVANANWTTSQPLKVDGDNNSRVSIWDANGKTGDGSVILSRSDRINKELVNSVVIGLGGNNPGQAGTLETQKLGINIEGYDPSNNGFNSGIVAIGSVRVHSNPHGVGRTGTGGQAVAIGNDVTSTSQAVAIGNNTYALGGSSIAIGNDDITTYRDKVTTHDYNNYLKPLYDKIDPGRNAYGIGNAGNAIYSPNVAGGEGSISIGSRSVAYKPGSTALGTLAYALGQGATALGTQSRAEGTGSIAIGNQTRNFANQALAIGNDSQILATGGTAVGLRARSGGEGSIAIGTDVYANAAMNNTPGSPMDVQHSALKNRAMGTDNLPSVESTVSNSNTINPTVDYFHDIGGIIQGNGKNALVIGTRSVALGTNSIALGRGAFAMQDNSFGIGSYSYANKMNSMAIGTSSRALAENSIALGAGTVATDSAINSTVIGTSAGVAGANSSLVGSNSEVFGDNSIAFGNNTNISKKGVTVDSGNNIAVGNNINIGPGVTNSMAYGKGATIGRMDTGNSNITNSTAFGMGASVTREYDGLLPSAYSPANLKRAAIANSKFMYTGNNAMAIGNNSNATLENSVALGVNSQTDYTYADLLKPGWTARNSIAIPTSGQTGVISVGSKGAERRIVNVASGANDTDAVNVIQLRTLEEKIENTVDGIETGMHYLSVNKKGGDTDSLQGSETVTELIERRKNYDLYLRYKKQELQIAAREKWQGEKFDPESKKKITDKLAEIANADTSGLIRRTAAGLGNITVEALPAGSTPQVEYRKLVEKIEDEIKKATTDAKYRELVDGTDIEALQTETNYSNKGANGTDSLAIGFRASTKKDNTVDSKQAIAMGYRATAENVNALAIGSVGDKATKASGISSIAIGNGTQTTSNYSVGLGGNAQVKGDTSIAIGDRTLTTASKATAVGPAAKGLGTNSVALGASAETGFLSKTETNGDKTYTGANYSTAIGGGATVYSNYSVAIGNGATVGETETTSGVTTLKTDTKASVVLGSGSKSLAEGGTVLGADSKATFTNSVALGRNVTTTASAGAGYLTNQAFADSGKVVSVGNRRINQLADGKNDDDAVTVAQLKALENKTLTTANAKITIAPDKNGTKEFTLGSTINLTTADVWGEGDNRFVGDNIETYKKDNGSILIGVKENPTFKTLKLNNGANNAQNLVLSADNAGNLSVGSKKITDVADGAANNDAVNVKQLNAVKTTAETAKSTADDAKTTANAANTAVTSLGNKQLTFTANSGNVTRKLGETIGIKGDNSTISTNAANNEITIKVKDKGIGTTQLADKAVTEAKLADNAVTTAKINNGAVTEAKLDNGLLNKINAGNTVATNNIRLAGDPATAGGAATKTNDVTLNKAGGIEFAINGKSGEIVTKASGTKVEIGLDSTLKAKLDKLSTDPNATYATKDEIANKANKNLDNIETPGQNVIKDQARKAVVVEAGNGIEVTSKDDATNHKTTYTVKINDTTMNKIGTGEVAANDENTVTGGKVNTYLTQNYLTKTNVTGTVKAADGSPITVRQGADTTNGKEYTIDVKKSDITGNGITVTNGEGKVLGENGVQLSIADKAITFNKLDQGLQDKINSISNNASTLNIGTGSTTKTVNLKDDTLKVTGSGDVTVSLNDNKEFTIGLSEDAKKKLDNVSAKSDGRDKKDSTAQGNENSSGNKGLTKEDKLNGKDLTDKVNALRNGEAGTVVFTDSQGNRLVKANDGKYYKPEFVAANGDVQPNAAGQTGVGIVNPELRVVNADGSTTTPNTLNNVASGLGLDGKKPGTNPETNYGKPISVGDAQTVVKGLATQTTGLNKAATVRDLQALTNAGLTFEANTVGDTTTSKVDRKLGETLKITGDGIKVSKNATNDGFVFSLSKGKVDTVNVKDKAVTSAKLAEDARTVVYITPDDKVVELGADGKLHKAEDLKGKTYVVVKTPQGTIDKTKTGYYSDNDVNADGELKTETAQKLDTPAVVDPATTTLRHALNGYTANGTDITTKSVLTNVGAGTISDKSTDAINGSQLKDVADKVGLTVGSDNKTLTLPALTGLKDSKGVAGAAPQSIVTGLNAVTDKVNEGIQYNGDLGTKGTQQLGTVFNVNAAGSTLTKTIAATTPDTQPTTINYVGDNLITKYTKNDTDGSGKLEIGFKESPIFKDVTADSITTKTLTFDDGTGKKLKVGPTADGKALQIGDQEIATKKDVILTLTKDGTNEAGKVDLSKDKLQVVGSNGVTVDIAEKKVTVSLDTDTKAKIDNIGKKSDGKDNKDSSKAENADSSGNKGLTKEDKLNGKDLTDKVNALRNGEAGTVVFTDKDGNRLVKANNGSYYKADEVGEDGNPKTLAGGAAPTAVAEADIELRVVDSKGETKNNTATAKGIKLSNVADGKIDANSKDAINGSQIKKVLEKIGVTTDANGNIEAPTITKIKDDKGEDTTVTAPTTLKDGLNAVIDKVNKGIQYAGDKGTGTQQLGTVFNVNKAGSTITEGAGTTAVNYVGDNVITRYTKNNDGSGKLEIGFKESPTFKDVTAGNITAGNIKATGNIEGKDGKFENLKVTEKIVTKEIEFKDGSGNNLTLVSGKDGNLYINGVAVPSAANAPVIYTDKAGNRVELGQDGKVYKPEILDGLTYVVTKQAVGEPGKEGYKPAEGGYYKDNQFKTDDAGAFVKDDNGNRILKTDAQATDLTGKDYTDTVVHRLSPIKKGDTAARVLTNVGEGTDANDAVNVSQLNKVKNNTIKLTADGVTPTAGGDKTNTETNTLKLDNNGGISFGIKGANGIETSATGTDVTVKLSDTYKTKLDNLADNADTKYATKDEISTKADKDATNISDDDAGKWRAKLGLANAVSGTGKLSIDAYTNNKEATEATATDKAKGTATVSLNGNENFKLVGTDGITVTGDATDKKKLTFGLDQATKEAIKNIGKSTSDGRDGKDGRDGANGTNGSHGLTAKDGLNGKDLTDKVNALRNGEAGTVVFTDPQGNRLVKANDGKYYKPEFVTATGDTKQNEKGEPAVAVDNPELRTVNSDGKTTTPIVLNNIASALGLDGKKPGTNPETNYGKPISVGDAQTVVKGLATQTTGLNKAVTLRDLQALAVAGLDFTGNAGTTHRALGTTLKIVGKDQGTGFDETKFNETYTTDNVATNVKADGTVEIGFKKSPTFDDVKAKNIEALNGKFENLKVNVIEFKTATGDKVTIATGKDGNLYINGVAVPTAESAPVIYTDTNGNRVEKGQDGKIYKPEDLKHLTYVAADPATGRKAGYFNEDQFETKDEDGKKVFVHDKDGNKKLKENQNPLDLSTKEYKGEVVHNLSPLDKAPNNPQNVNDPQNTKTPKSSRLVNVAAGVNNTDAVNVGQLNALKTNTIKLDGNTGSTGTQELGKENGLSFGIKGTNGIETSASGTDVTVKLSDTYKSKLDNLDANANDKYANKNADNIDADTWKAKLGLSNAVSGTGKLSIDAVTKKDTTETNNGKATVKLDGNENFKLVGTDGITVTGNVDDATDKKTLTFGLDQDTKDAIKNIGKSTSDGRDGRDGTNGTNGSHGLTAKDGLNGKDLTDKVNALRNGEAGTVVFTDPAGNRLVKANDGNYYKANKVKANGDLENPADAIKKATNGKYYAADKVDATGALTDPNATPVEYNPELRVVNTDGTTTNPITLNNLASALEAVREQNKAVTPEKAQEAVKALLAKTTGLDKAVNLADLQAIAQAGLDFTGNAGSTHRALGTTLKIVGKAQGTDFDETKFNADYSTDNVATNVKTDGTVEIGFKKSPKFTDVKADNIEALNGKFENLKVKEKIETKEIIFKTATGNNVTIATGKDGNLYINGVAVPTAETAPVIYTNEAGDRVELGQDGKVYKPEDLKHLTYVAAKEAVGNPGDPNYAPAVTAGYYGDNKFKKEDDGVTFKQDSEGNKILIAGATPENLSSKEYKGEVLHKLSPLSKTDPNARRLVNVAAGKSNTDAVNVGQLNAVKDTPIKFKGDTENDVVTRKLGETLNITGDGVKVTKNKAGDGLVLSIDKGKVQTKNVADQAVTSAKLAQDARTVVYVTQNNEPVELGADNKLYKSADLQGKTYIVSTDPTIQSGYYANGDLNADKTAPLAGKTPATLTAVNPDPNKGGEKLKHALNGYIPGGTDVTTNSVLTNVGAGEVSATSKDAINGSQFHKVAKNEIKLTADGVTPVGGGAKTNTETNALNLDNNGGISFGIKGADGITTTADGTNVTVKLDTETKKKLDNLDADANNKYAKKDATNMTGLTDEEKAKWREAIGLGNAVTGTGKLQIDAYTNNKSEGETTATDKAKGKATVKLDGTQNFKLVGKDGVTIAGNDTEGNTTLTFGLDEATTDKLKNITAVLDGKDGKATNGTDGSNGSHGLTGKDGLNGKDLTTKVNALRNGEAGTVVFTDSAGNRLVKANDGNYYKADKVKADGSLVDPTDAIKKANDGKYYAADKVDATGVLTDQNATPVEYNPELRVVNEDGTTTAPNKLSNIADGKIDANSKDAINGSQIKNVLDKMGVEIDPATGEIKQPEITAIKGKDGKDGVAKTSVVAGLNEVIKTVNSGIKYNGDLGTEATQQLGSTFSVNAATGNLNKDAEPTINYVGSNLITKYTKGTDGNGKLEIGLKESPTFKDVTADNLKANTQVEAPKVVIKGKPGADGAAGKDAVLTADDNGNLKVGDKIITAGAIELGLTGKTVKADNTETIVGGATADKVNLSTGEKLEVVGKDGVTVDIAGKSVTLGLDKATTDKLKNITAVSDGKDGKDATDPANGANGTNGSHGLTGKDGLNGKDLTTKVNALRNGEAGTVVYTDAEGNRLVKANDGKYYPVADVEANGNVKPGVDPNRGTTNPELRTVNADGTTTNPITLNNIASALGLDGKKPGATPEANYDKPITAEDAKKVMETLVGKNTDLNKAVTLRDLQALAVAGLDFTGNTGTAHRALGTTLNVAGQGTPAADFAGASGNIKVEASEDTANKIAKLEIQLAEALKGIKSIQNDKTKITLDENDGVKVDGKDGGKVVVNGKDGTDGVTITGTNGTDGSSIVVNGKDGAAGKDSVTIKGGNGTNGSSIAVNGKDGKDGVTIKGTDGTNGSSISVNGKDGKPGVTINGGNGTDGATIAFDKKTDAQGNTAGTGSITGLKDPELNDDGTPKDKTAATTVNYVTNKIEGAKTEIKKEITNLIDGGMTYKGNSGEDVKVKLNKAVNIKGEGNYDGTGSATGNIAVVGNNTDSTLEIKLNKDLKNIDTISKDDTKITLDKNDGVKVDGKDGGKVIVNGKDGKATVGINGGNGTNGASVSVNGKDGKDGVTIKGTDGTNGSSIVVHGKDGKDGKDGVTIKGGDGTNGATITFDKKADGTGTGSITGLKDPELNDDGTPKDKTAATTVNYVTNQITNVTNKINDVANKMDKGLNFVGNDTTKVVNTKLDGTVSIKGEGTIPVGTNTAANNITVEKDTTAGATGLVVKLADKLTGMTGFETKDDNDGKVKIDKAGVVLTGKDGKNGVTIKPGNGTDAATISFNKTDDGKATGKITGVKTDENDKTSVATVEYVESKIGSGMTFGADDKSEAQKLGTTLEVKAATEKITAAVKEEKDGKIVAKAGETTTYTGKNLTTTYTINDDKTKGTISVAMTERPEFAAVTVGTGNTKATLDGEKGSLEFNKTIEKGKDGKPIVYANNDGKIVTYKDENGKVQPIYKQRGEGTISGLKDVDYLEVDGNRVAIDRTQAANAGYVDDQLEDVRTRITNNTTRITELNTESRAGIAGVAAMANIPQINDAGSNKYNISVGIGKHRGETAYALGISGVSDGGRVVYKASAALDSQNKVTAGIGLGYQFGKRDIEANELDRFKAQMALLQTDSTRKFEKLEREQQRMREEQEAIKATHNRMQEAIVAIDKKTDAIDKLNQMKMNQLEERINQKVEKIDSLNQLKINQINKEMEKVKNKLKIYK